MADEQQLGYRSCVGREQDKHSKPPRTKPGAASKSAKLIQDLCEEDGSALNPTGLFIEDILGLIKSERHRNFFQAVGQLSLNTPRVIAHPRAYHQTPTPPPQPEMPSDTHMSGSQSEQEVVESKALEQMSFSEFIRFLQSVPQQKPFQAVHPTSTRGRPPNVTKFKGRKGHNQPTRLLPRRTGSGSCGNCREPGHNARTCRSFREDTVV